jgi:hypothetical protein
LGERLSGSQIVLDYTEKRKALPILELELRLFGLQAHT